MRPWLLVFVVAAVAGLAAPARADAGGGWVFLPGGSLTPDAGFALGGAALRYFHFAPGARPSRLAINLQVSVDGETELNVDPEVWFAADRWSLSGASKVAYLESSFFGVGNDTVAADEETYDAVRFEGRVEAVRKVGPGLFVGAMYFFRAEHVLRTEPGGALAGEAVSGSHGGEVAGLGPVARWDTRDNSFAPRRGFLIYASTRLFHRYLGGDFDFTRTLIDGSFFFNPWRDHVVAIDSRIDLRHGSPPFDELSTTGGKRFERGMLEGRFRDRHKLGAQLEYRFPVYWRFGAVAFAGLGRVAPRVDEFGLDGLKYSVGAGVRYEVDRAERVHLRLDLATSSAGTAVYATILEAF